MNASCYPREIHSGLWPYGHCQGIAVDKTKRFIYFSFTTALIKMDFQGNVIGTVTGLLGHLGCIDFCESDGRVYGSLEYKNDAIGQGILQHAGHTGVLQDAFYIAIFDADRINRRDMDACKDGVMTAVYLRDVVADYHGQVLCGDRVLPHRYGCSGIDGTTFGILPGASSQSYRLFVAYGIYGDTTRTDNDNQVLLCYDTADWRQYEQPLSQENMHTSGPEKPEHTFFVHTGNTTYGVQNLEYDEHTGHFFMAVYRGSKSDYPNYDLYVIDGSKPPMQHTLTLLSNGKQEKTPGWHYPYGATGMCALGDGYFYISQDGKCGEMYYTKVVLCRWDGQTPFAETV